MYKYKNMSIENISYVIKDGKQDRRSINITINGQPIVLSVDDCITFTSDHYPGNTYIAKITGFRYDEQFRSIFFKPWDGTRWGAQDEIRIQRKCWVNPQSIIKLKDCPETVAVAVSNGGKRNSRKLIKRFRRNTRRQQRK